MQFKKSRFGLFLSLLFLISVNGWAQNTNPTHKSSVNKLITEYLSFINSESNDPSFLKSKQVYISKPERDETTEPYFSLIDLKQLYINKYGDDYKAVFNTKSIKISEILIDKKLNTYYSTVKIPQQIRSTELQTSYTDTIITDSVLVDSIYTYTTRTDSILTTDTVKKSANSTLKLYITFDYKDSQKLYTNHVIEAIAFDKRPYKHQPLSKLANYWVSLDDSWRDLIQKKLNFPEVVSDYYLDRIAGISNLDLSESEITDFTPLAEFKGLKVLDLSNRPLDTLLYVKDCIKLKDLSINNCSLTSLHGLEKLVSLEVLQAAVNEIVDLTPIKDATKIVILNLNENKIVDISPLKGMRSMSRLYLNLNEIESLGALKNMIVLSELYIKKNRDIKSLEPIRNHQTLVKLDCFNTKITSLDPIKNHRRMVFLDCGYTQVKSLDPIRYHIELRHLAFKGNAITDFSSLNKLDRLTYLNCSNTSISEITAISRMDRLKKLDAINTKFSKGDIQRFKKKHPKVGINYYYK